MIKKIKSASGKRFLYSNIKILPASQLLGRLPGHCIQKYLKFLQIYSY